MRASVYTVRREDVLLIAPIAADCRWLLRSIADRAILTAVVCSGIRLQVGGVDDILILTPIGPLAGCAAPPVAWDDPTAESGCYPTPACEGAGVAVVMATAAAAPSRKGISGEGRRHQGPAGVKAAGKLVKELSKGAHGREAAQAASVEAGGGVPPATKMSLGKWAVKTGDKGTRPGKPAPGSVDAAGAAAAAAAKYLKERPAEHTDVETSPLAVTLSTRHADISGVDLLMSVFITEQRKIASLAGRNRFPRFDAFLFTLQSYAPLPLDRVFLFVELDAKLPDVAAKRLQLEQTAAELFHGRLVTLQHRRLVSQLEWQQAWRQWIAPPSADPADDSERLVFFTQNDDHPFVDFNQASTGLGPRLAPGSPPARDRPSGHRRQPHPQPRGQPVESPFHSPATAPSAAPCVPCPSTAPCVANERRVEHTVVGRTCCERGSRACALTRPIAFGRFSCPTGPRCCTS